MEIDLLKNYPKPKRNLEKRLLEKTPIIIETARKFGEEFFDGDRKYGYGGFSYKPKYWSDVVLDFAKFYNLKPDAKILDVGCAKGYMLYDFKRQFPDMDVYGIDISEYAIKNCHPDVKEHVSVGNANELNFEDNFFDLVISVNTVHNLNLEECKKSLIEISRVTKSNSFLTLDAFTNNEEKERMHKWNLTAKTILSVSDWKILFSEVGYNGDYYWFIP